MYAIKFTLVVTKVCLYANLSVKQCSFRSTDATSEQCSDLFIGEETFFLVLIISWYMYGLLAMSVSHTPYIEIRGGSRNYSAGWGGWGSRPEFFKGGGGLGSRSAGIFIY